jgi:hypothetical protein
MNVASQEVFDVKRNRNLRGTEMLPRIVAAIALLALAGCDEEPQKAPVDPCTEQPCSIDAVVAQLEDAYQNRDYPHLLRLLHDDFQFVLYDDPYRDPSLPPPPPHWGKAEELRINRRMWIPSIVVPQEQPLPIELWIVAANATIAPMQPWTEVPEYYAGPSNPTGLDSTRWKAWGAEYNAQALIETRGETDYQISARAWFVVAQDLSKTDNAAGAYSLYRWQDIDLDEPATAIDRANWTQLKCLYR